MLFTDRMARWIWGGILQGMRRPRVRRVQRLSMASIPEDRREAFRSSVVKRERYARKIGLPLLTWTLRAFFLYAAALVLYFVGLDLQDRGLLPTPGQSLTSQSE